MKNSMTTQNPLNPWNWFQNEEIATPRTSSRRESSSLLPLTDTMSMFGPLSSFYKEMDRMFGQAFRGFGMPSMLGETGLPTMLAQTGMFRPNIDIASTDNEYTVTAEMPGIDERDIKIELADDNTLTIRGEKKNRKPE